MRTFLPGLIGMSLAALLWAGCAESENPVAPYEGHRPLILQRVTQSYTPDIQWLGGRVAAAGVNRGESAALDSTLVWLVTADGDEIDSHLTVGEGADVDRLAQLGAMAVDSLTDGETYTFWLATEEAFSANLSSSSLNEHTFVDSTVAMRLVLSGTQRGRAPVELQITRDQRLTGTRYVVSWTPEDHAFRRIAIRKGAASAAFTNLIWHVVLPDDEEDSITSPVVIGETPPGAEVAVEFPESGFVQDTYTLWMVDSNWDESFGINPPGMAAFVMFSSNFEN